MSESYDVAARLAQGQPAVDNVARYVLACHQLGYQHPDLTLHPSQCTDWYRTEDGMDLGALQRDCLALEAAVRSAHDALAVQESQLARLTAVWQGVGAQAADEFLRRHATASAAVAAAVRTAADALSALREELWRAVTTKVDAAVAIEERAVGSRAEWLAASTTLTTGVGDRVAAGELVEHAVKPFVDNSVRTDWLTAMRAGLASVTAAYERAVAEIEAERPPVFGVPGDLGPVWTPPVPAIDDRDVDPAPAAERTAPATVPSAWSAPPMAVPAAPSAPAAPVPLVGPAVSAPAPAVAAPPPPAEPPLPAAPVPAAPPLGSMGSGMPDLGGGLSGLGQQFADTLSGLLGDVHGGIPAPELESPDLEEPDLEDAEGREETEAEEDTEDPVEDEEVEEPQEDSEEPLPEEDAAGTEDAPAEPAAAPTPPPPPPAAPPPAEPLPPAEQIDATQTPCEIAADELPQVGGAPE